MVEGGPVQTDVRLHRGMQPLCVVPDTHLREPACRREGVEQDEKVQHD